MLHPVNPDDRLIAARLLDFFSSSTPWHRGLWNPGLSLTLREMLEASEAFHNSVLHESVLQALGSSCLRLSGRDPGAGDEHELHTLQSLLKKTVVYDGLEYHALRTLANRVESKYMERWAEEFRISNDRPKVERTARSVASHLLDLGFSSNYLHRWWKFKLHHEAGTRTLADILEDAHTLSQRQFHTYDVLIVLDSSPAAKSGYPPEWRNAAQVSAWLKSNSFSVSGLRPRGGGLVFSIKARDPESASQLAGEHIDHLVARIAVGTGKTAQINSRIWVAGQPNPFPRSQYVRGVRVRALHREDRVYQCQDKAGVLDAAIELLSHLESSSPSAAAAGGWAAIEALLSAPKDRGVAADRLAALVACSFPRAELTALSYALKEDSPANASILSKLSSCSENRERCSVIAKAIEAGQPLEFRTQSDFAARKRIEKVIRSPRTELRDIRTHTGYAFSRLYRQRNLVLHWGKTDAVALRAALRTAAPLVGAGMDRIAHSLYVEDLRPIELAARAHVSLETIPVDQVDACISLLSTSGVSKLGSAQKTKEVVR